LAGESDDAGLGVVGVEGDGGGQLAQHRTGRSLAFLGPDQRFGRVHDDGWLAGGGEARGDAAVEGQGHRVANLDLGQVADLLGCDDGGERAVGRLQQDLARGEVDVVDDGRDRGDTLDEGALRQARLGEREAESGAERGDEKGGLEARHEDLPYSAATE
jgi:hypothetical protein